MLGTGGRIRTFIHGVRDHNPAVERHLCDLADPQGIEPRPVGPKPTVLPLNDRSVASRVGLEPTCARIKSPPFDRVELPTHLERHERFELSPTVWKTVVLAIEH